MAVIRVSGYPGSGKTTLCKRLAGALGYEYHYAGCIFRDMADEQGLSIEEFYAKLASDPSLESDVDDRLGALMREKDNLIMEGRVVPFLPSPFKKINVLLTVDEIEGARRAKVRKENQNRTEEEIIMLTRERLENEEKHYKRLHGIEGHLDPQNFDIVINTTHMTPNEVFEKTLAEIRKRV